MFSMTLRHPRIVKGFEECGIDDTDFKYVKQNSGIEVFQGEFP